MHFSAGAVECRYGAHLFLPVTRILVASMTRTARPASWTALIALATWITYDHSVRSGMRLFCACNRPFWNCGAFVFTWASNSVSELGW